MGGIADPRLVPFFSVVSKRLGKGALEYGERSWSADPETLAREILEELADVAGWAAIIPTLIEVNAGEAVAEYDTHAVVAAALADGPSAAA